MINDDQDLAAEYNARGIPTEWQDITPETFGHSFRLHYRAYQSPDPDAPPSAGRDEAERFLHDPVQALIEGDIIPDEGLDDQGRRRLPRISTMVVNHERTLKRFIMHAFVAVSNNPHTVGITIVKEEKPEPSLD